MSASGATSSTSRTQRSNPHQPHAPASPAVAQSPANNAANNAASSTPNIAYINTTLVPLPPATAARRPVTPSHANAVHTPRVTTNGQLAPTHPMSRPRVYIPTPACTSCVPYVSPIAYACNSHCASPVPPATYGMYTCSYAYVPMRARACSCERVCASYCHAPVHAYNRIRYAGPPVWCNPLMPAPFAYRTHVGVFAPPRGPCFTPLNRPPLPSRMPAARSARLTTGRSSKHPYPW